MVIESLLDTDLYKFTMMQCVLHQFPGAMVKYRFRCRTPGVNLRKYLPEIKYEIEHLCSLKFRDSELEFLDSLRYIRRDFVDFLSLFHLKQKYIRATVSDKEPCGIDITVEGPWLHTILFEIPVLAIVSEVYFRHNGPKDDFAEGRRRLEAKCRALLDEPDNDGLFISDFGARRRFSRQWHDYVVGYLTEHLGRHFSGTSDVLFAKKYGVTPMGTMAHEYLQACQALGPRLRDSQVYGFDMWAKEYRGDLGIALSDVYGLQPFLNDFDMYFCKLFDGARQDSGDPVEWGEAMIRHYAANKCDPLSKTLIFSDSLNIPRVLELYRRFKHRIRLAFGVGTNLVNDVGPQPLNIVIKMIEANGQPVAKISDTPGKSMCEDPTYLAYLRQVFGLDSAPGFLGKKSSS